MLRVVEHCAQRRQVVAVDLEHPPPVTGEDGRQVDSAPGVGPVASVPGSGRPAVLLQPVAVDDGNEAAESVPGSGVHRFPHHPLLELPVTEQHPGAEVLVPQPGAERHADPDGQALTERAGGGVDAGEEAHVRVSLQP